MHARHLPRELASAVIFRGYQVPKHGFKVSTFEVLECGTLVRSNFCEEQENIATSLTHKSGTTLSYGKLGQESDNFKPSMTKREATQTLKPAAS